jgi:cyclopropane-fatty-acyl-phospholipid synthase
MLFQSAVLKQVEQWIADVRRQADIPLHANLWGEYGFDFGRSGPPLVTLTVKDASALPQLLEPSLNNLGRLYVEGLIDVRGHLSDIIDCAYKLADATLGTDSTLMRAVRHFAHSKHDDRQSIAYHYDVSNDFYRLWLDENMVYSCAYFERGDEDLDRAQRQKIDHILSKIRLEPGQSLLDIGCGWGALVIRAAQKYQARCVGITLSEAQFEYARDRVRAAGLERFVEIRLQDYRDIQGQFDRITSVGMFEHVGRKNLVNYFGIMKKLLRPGGIAMNHGITSTDPDGGETRHGGGDFIDQYVFPQGELPHLSQVIHSMQQAGLETLDVENLRRHYMHTLTCWSERYEAQTEAIRRMVDDKTYRIWRVYLAGCAHAFAIDQVSIHQVLCHHAGEPAAQLPWSRRYIYDRQPA